MNKSKNKHKILKEVLNDYNDEELAAFARSYIPGLISALEEDDVEVFDPEVYGEDNTTEFKYPPIANVLSKPDVKVNISNNILKIDIGNESYMVPSIDYVSKLQKQMGEMKTKYDALERKVQFFENMLKTIAGGRK